MIFYRIKQSEGNAGSATRGLTDRYGSLDILVSLKDSTDTVVLSHRDLTHQVRLLLLLHHHLLLMSLSLVLLSVSLLLTIAVRRLGEGALIITTTEDAAALLLGSLLSTSHLLLLTVHLLLLLLHRLSLSHHLLLRHTLADTTHSHVVLLLRLLHLLLGLIFTIVSTDRERGTATGRGKNTRRGTISDDISSVGVATGSKSIV